MTEADAELMRGVLQRIATGPSMSKDLPRDDARRAMRSILDGRADEVQAGLFLIALRMKRESDEELAGILEAIRDGMPTRALSVDELVCIADPYDGCLRGTPVSAFLPPVLAACGLRVLSHGVDAMGPKFGASHAGVLRAADHTLAGTLDRAAARLESPTCGWAYIDQALLAPELAALSALRTRIVKRPCLTTIEATLCCFEPRMARHLVTGFVHTGYPEIYARLAHVAGFRSALLVRGVEGSVVPSLSQPSRYARGIGDEALHTVDIDPTALGIEQTMRALPLPALSAAVSQGARSVSRAGNADVERIAAEGARRGLEALRGMPGMARDALVLAGAVVLHGLAKVGSLHEGATRVREVLDDGAALARLADAKAPG